MHLKDRKSPLDVRSINGHLAIETTGSHQRGIEHVRTVGGRDDDDAAVALEAVHFGEQLIQGLLALIVAAALLADQSIVLAAITLSFALVALVRKWN